MPDKPGSIEELKGMVGVELKPITVEIEKSLIRRFVEATEDNNPLWQNEKLAKKNSYGGIVAPPGFFCTFMMSGVATQQPDIPWPFQRGLGGGGEWEIYQPVRVGDIITAITKLVDVHELGNQRGKMYLVLFETSHKNQNGEIVARSRTTIIGYL